ncbi:S1 family peptidase [Ancylothrix sp. C2]|uniref:S1 family peptidase n=1 Tax=Ancylothrix sp. D3o TaxID=2953691 RepID=UPI0021BAC0D2|nr:S1 family peptidase [Ancylothrix sp. D3o]MCT7949940.1 S1 family peptidase [Ancylothrix sp. D3o]
MPANRLIIAILATVATVTSNQLANAGTMRHDRTDTQYRTLANSFSSVGSLSLRGATSSWNCSGTLIGTNYLLTAAHCLEDSAGQNLIGGTFTLGGTRYNIGSGVKNSGWTTSNRNPTAGFDMAILQLTSNVTNVSAATLSTATNENGQTGTYVGFGFRGTGTTGQVANTFGTKRAGQNIMNLGSQLGWSDQVLWSDFTDPRLNANAALNLEYNIASGDSGGGLFINGLLAGVNSVIQNANRNTLWADYGDRSLVTRVSSLNNWIQNVVNTGFPSSGITTASSPSTSTSTNMLNAVAISDDLTAVEDLVAINLYDDVYSNTKVPEPSAILGLGLLGSLLTLKWGRRK